MPGLARRAPEGTIAVMYRSGSISVARPREHTTRSESPLFVWALLHIIMLMGDLHGMSAGNTRLHVTGLDDEPLRPPGEASRSGSASEQTKASLVGSGCLLARWAGGGVRAAPSGVCRCIASGGPSAADRRGPRGFCPGTVDVLSRLRSLAVGRTHERGREA